MEMLAAIDFSELPDRSFKLLTRPAGGRRAHPRACVS
jgi:hypothetical protein